MPPQTKPWTINAVPNALRAAAIAVAERDRCNVDEWAIQAIQYRVDISLGKGVQVNTQANRPISTDIEAIALVNLISNTFCDVPEDVENSTWDLARRRLKP